MSEGSAAAKKSTEQLRDEIQARLGKPSAKVREKKEVKEAAQDSKFASIKSNPYHAVFFNENLTPEEKKAQIVALQTFSGTKAENAERVAAFVEFKEYLQFKRQEMAKAFMKLASTSDFAELQAIQDQMNSDILDFEKKMEPLTSMLEALYSLRTGGDNLIYEAFKEIEAEKEAAKEREQQLKEEEQKIAEIESKMKANKRSIIELGQQKKFVFFGGPPASAVADIAEMEVENDDLTRKLERIQTNIQEIRSGVGKGSSLPPELLASKEKLKELLDLTSKEHIDRQKALQDAAIKFVETSQKRSAPVLGALEGLDKRVGQIYEANGTLRGIYAIMDDASKEVTDINQSKRSEIQGQLGEQDLSSMRRLELEDSAANIDEHIGSLEMTYQNTTKDLVKLSEQRGRIQTARSNNQQQITKTRDLMSSGIGGVADQLVTVLNGISQAALAESSETLGDSIGLMDKKTRAVSEKGALSRVYEQAQENTRLTQALEQFRSYGETMRVSSDMFREQMGETMALRDDLKVLAEDIQDAVRDSASAVAEAREDYQSGPHEDDGEAPATPAPKKEDDPFSLG